MRTPSHTFFSRNTVNADIAVIEGVMGMYDGYGGYSDGGSTAHVARIIGAPVILVVNGEGMSLSIVPLIKGFMDFDRDVKVRGVILNNINSEAHFGMLKEIIEEHLGISVLGYLKNMPEITLASRHLGLVPEGEIKDLRQKIALLTEELRKTVNLELLLKIAAEDVTPEKIAAEGVAPGKIAFEGVMPQKIAEGNVAPDKGEPLHTPYVTERESRFFEKYARFTIKSLPSGARIAVAKDKAFNFYYRDNLDLLEMMGAELVYFSPLRDNRLPDGINGLYLGGGYPEVFAAQLEENTEMRECLKSRISEGLPAYAECGGLMYLAEGIINGDGEKFDMVGVIPGLSKMTGSLQRFGYIEIDVVEDNILAAKGDKIRAHEFHYSVTEVEGEIPACFSIKKSRKNGEARIWKCGYKFYNLLAGYPHLHFWSNPGFAGRFVDNCLRFGGKV